MVHTKLKQHLVGPIVIVVLMMAIAWAFSTYLYNTATALAPPLQGSAYRLFDSSNSTTPGTPLAATNAGAQLTAQGQSFRMRTGITARPNAIEPTFTQAGYRTSCIVVSSLLYCAGRATNGELGNGSRTSTNTYTPVDTTTGLAGKTITDIAIGPLTNNYVTVCAVASGDLYCWGSNQYSTLGIDKTVAQTVDTAVPMQAVMSGTLAGQSVQSIDAGDGHSCGVTTSGKGFCWGTNGAGRLGDGTATGRNKPTEIYMSGVLAGKTITHITAGSGHGCALAGGAVYCWGTGTAGQLGDGLATNSNFPVAVSTSGVLAGKTIVDLASALNSTCVLDSAGKSYCWGANTSAVFGDGTANVSNIPVATDMSLVVGGGLSSISAKSDHVCGIGISDQQLYCWGGNSSGGTGRGVTGGVTTRATPVTTTGMLSGKFIASVSTGTSTTCGVTTTSEAFCFGYNTDGNFGVGTTTASYSTAIQVPTTSFTPAQGVTVNANTIDTRLEFAAKTAGTCATQTTGFTAVTTTSAIAWSTNGSVASGAGISATAADPISGGTTTLQSYVSAAANMTNPATIPAGNTGLWDFSLKDNSGLFNQSYCLRLAQSNGTAYGVYAAYPEIKTAQGVLSVSIVDAASQPVVTPSVGFPNTATATSCQSVGATLGTSTQKIRINNDTTNASWSLNMAATNGSSSQWQHTTDPYSYDFNDSSGSPAGCNSGLDGDGKAGQLMVNPSAAGSTVSPKSGCQTTGITKGGQQGFIENSVNAITLLSASSSTSNYCYWDFTGVGLSQTIPASQQRGTYTIDMTLTVVAQ